MRGADLINLLIPDELLEEILRRVGAAGSKRDLDACALVCRRWRRRERACRRAAKLAASGDDADEVLRLVAERFPALVDVSVDERLTAAAAASAVVEADARLPRRMQSLSAARRRKVPHSGWTASANRMERSCLTDIGLTYLARGCKGLEKLSLIWCSAISSEGLARIAENCKNLRSLDLQACYVGDQGLIAIGKGCKLLSDLNLRFVEGTTDEGLVGLVNNCGTSLVSLGVATCAWVTDVSLHAVGSHCPNLEVLSLQSEYIKNEGIISVARGCRLLKTLKLQCIGSGDEALEAVGSFCSSLETLSLNNFERFTDRSLSSIAKGCKKLKDLILNDCQLLTDRSLEFIARSCKNLARLKINGCHTLETAALEHIGQWCPGLLELSLIYCPRIRNSAFLEVGRGCSLLRSLCLVDCSTISDDAICHIAEGCKNLRELSLQHCYEIGDRALISVGENCKLLRELALHFCDRVSDVGLAAIAEGCFLQKLNICGCVGITDNGLTAIARGCPDIVYLDISVLQMIGDMALAEIGEGCPQLKDIALSHCPEITDVGLSHLIKGCSQLETCQMVYCNRVTTTGVATIISGCSKLKRLLVEEWKEIYAIQTQKDQIGIIFSGIGSKDYSNMSSNVWASKNVFSALSSYAIFFLSTPKFGKPRTTHTSTPQMEKGGGGDPARAVGMSRQFMTFLAKSPSLNQPNNITVMPRNANHDYSSSSSSNHVDGDEDDDDDDDFNIPVEKVEFQYHQGDDDNTTIPRGSTAGEEKKVKGSVTIKDFNVPVQKVKSLSYEINAATPRAKQSVMAAEDIDMRAASYIKMQRFPRFGSSRSDKGGSSAPWTK